MIFRYHWCYVCDGSVRDKETGKQTYHNVVPLGKVIGAFQCGRCGSGGNVFEVKEYGAEEVYKNKVF